MGECGSAREPRFDGRGVLCQLISGSLDQDLPYAVFSIRITLDSQGLRARSLNPHPNPDGQPEGREDQGCLVSFRRDSQPTYMAAVVLAVEFALQAMPGDVSRSLD